MGQQIQPDRGLRLVDSRGEDDVFPGGKRRGPQCPRSRGWRHAGVHSDGPKIVSEIPLQPGADRGIDMRAAGIEGSLNERAVSIDRTAQVQGGSPCVLTSTAIVEILSILTSELLRTKVLA
jgi:hypothetical protein